MDEIVDLIVCVGLWAAFVLLWAKKAEPAILSLLS